MHLSRRAKVWLFVGYGAFIGGFMAVAHWQGWTALTEGPRPMGIWIPAVVYVVIVLFTGLLREESQRGGPGTIQVDRPAPSTTAQETSDDSGS